MSEIKRDDALASLNTGSLNTISKMYSKLLLDDQIIYGITAESVQKFGREYRDLKDLIYSIHNSNFTADCTVSSGLESSYISDTSPSSVPLTASELPPEDGLTRSLINSYNSKKHVALVGGGMSAERLVSYESSDGIAKSLRKLGYAVTFVDMGEDIASVLAAIKPDVVFNALHGTYGEDGCLPGILNILKIPYTGSGVLASSVALNKKIYKQILSANNIPTIEMEIIRKGQDILSIKKPYVIKPISQGSSIGVKVVLESDDFVFNDYDFPYGDEVIVEKYIKGRELQVAVLNGKSLGVLEIELLQGKLFYDYQTKYSVGFANHNLNPVLPALVYDKVTELSEKACSLINASGLLRVEFVYDQVHNVPYILEVNTHPGMTKMSICPEIALSRGISYDSLVDKLISEAKFE